uniref:WGS project CAEQ00000000 data, annotated contig 1830 n=1 Tax=Trypanosoma congolense (strain IL3000) TaxID=1068625 RepID=F9W976_TRYCI|nr:unnamed protein product [Trypanosoma congolense IL3000]
MVKVLCLHGKGQTGEMFEHQLNKMCVALASIAEFDFMDAPHSVQSDELGTDIAAFSWSGRSPGADDDYETCDDAVRQHISTAAVPYDVVLGFSQGGLAAIRYVMQRELLGGDAYGPPLKGVVMAATPDPRRVFPDLVASYVEFVRPASDKDDFLCPLPSLHVVGRKDGVVDPKESAAFADACKPRADLLWHDHAHSIPMVKSVIDSIGSFLKRVTRSNQMENCGSDGFPVAYEEDLNMIACIYGEDCIQRSEGASVTLSLLFNLSDEDLEGSPIAALRLRLLLRAGCSIHLPKIDILGGPPNRHWAYERWKTSLITDITEFMRENMDNEGNILLPAIMFAAERASNDVDFLRSVFDEGEHSCAVSNCVTWGQQDPHEIDNLWWEKEDEEHVRTECIAEAHQRAEELLSGEAPIRQTCSVRGAEVATRVGASPKGGSLEFIIGLIGKPSSGKSTFYNAITNPDNEGKVARVSALPFTTIEPNVGRGLGPVFCPCSVPQLASAHGQHCDAADGHVFVSGTRYRRHPIMVKDVAGLVRGAYRGRGKGNRFLNDLCDANVLVHVVDGAAATQADGSACVPGTGSTRDDITWVRGELHSWIYDNLRFQWGGIIRKPQKIRTMFTGYGSPPSFVDALLHRLGITHEEELSRHVQEWGAKELHLLVAVYVRLRFPIVVALNKADMRAVADKLCAELKELYPCETFVQMSAKMEYSLLKMQREGVVRYASGETHFEEVVGQSSDPKIISRNGEAVATVGELREFFDSSCSGITTGVQRVLATALSLCSGHLVYPVGTIKQPLDSLVHCFAFKQGTSAGVVFDTLLRSALLDGKLVRFEAVEVQRLAAGCLASALKRNETLPGKHVVVRALTNKKQLAV